MTQWAKVFVAMPEERTNSWELVCDLHMHCYLTEINKQV